MKRTLSILLACIMIVSLLAACGGTTTPTTVATTTVAATEATTTASTAAPEIVDGKFVKTRNITVEIFDRGNDGGTPPEDNFYTNFIKEGMMRDHNVAVEFVPVGRWTEVDDLNNLLAAGGAPDICVTYSYPTIQTYANMGGVLDLAPYIDGNKELLTNLFELLKDENVYYDKDPVTGTLWAVEARLYNNTRINTFVREDWLKKLNIAEPKNITEFETMLKAFKDNASTLLGADAEQMIPFSLSFDIGWRADPITTAFVPDAITDKDRYIYGFDDRHILYPGTKDGIKVLNTWYNEGLIWKDFPLYGKGDTTEDNLIKSGYVGAFCHNYEYPYRGGEEGITANLHKLVGPDANYIAVEPFLNDAGIPRKYLGGTVDRKVFFPATNDEPIASLMYIDWISKFENRNFLQIGEEGVTHEKQVDGSVKTIAATGEKIMNSGTNIDYTITINGLDMGTPDLSIKSLAMGYAGVDKSYIERAYKIGQNQGRVMPGVQVGQIKAEEGMGTALPEKRDVFLTQAVVAPADQFDTVYDSGMADYLASGGQAIIDERKAAYEKVYK